jgi:hypothetical protein
LQARFASLGVAVKNVEDDRRPIEHARSRRALEIARLAGRNLVVDDDRGRGGRRHVASFDDVALVCVDDALPVFAVGWAAGRAGPLHVATRLRLDGCRSRRDEPFASRESGELSKLALAEHGGCGQRVALLRDGAHD